MRTIDAFASLSISTDFPDTDLRKKTAMHLKKIIIASVAAAALTLTACGESDGTDATTTSATTEETTVEETTTEEAIVEETTVEETTAEESPEEQPAEEEAPAEQDVPREHQNALRSADNYLSFTAFSQTGLYDQLLFEEYSPEAAQYAVDNVGADWNEQAVKSAENYLDFTSFSPSGLYDQLVYEGFTPEQAQYGVDNAY